MMLAACESSPSDPEDLSLNLRIANDTAEPIAVEVIATERVSAGDRKNADFGTIGPQQITNYRQVSHEFVILVNGVPFPDEDMPFGVSNPPSSRWTFRIQANGGWSQDADFD